MRSGLCTWSVLLACACGGDGGSSKGEPLDSGTAPGGEKDSEVDGSDAGEQLPEDVIAFDTDDEAISVATISGLLGGTATATATDGTTYELMVPPLALASDVEVTLIPFRTVLGVTESGAVHGVQLAPEGLHFQGMARLVITPPDALEPASLLAFDSEGGGSQPGAAVVDPDAEELVILLDRFRVSGIASASAEERDALFAIASDSAELTLRHRVGAALQDVWRAARAGETPSPVDLRDDYAAYESAALEPLAGSASESCDMRAQYLDSVLDYAQLASLLGDLPSSAELYTFLPLYQRQNNACDAEMVSQCRASEEPGYLLEYRLRSARAQELAIRAELVPDEGDRDLNAVFQSVQAICAMGGYTASGGGAGLTLSGELDDPTYPFVLAGTISGTELRVVFAPDESNRNRGSYEYESGTISGSGSYTLSDTANGKSITLEGFACANDLCDPSSATVTLAPR